MLRVPNPFMPLCGDRIWLVIGVSAEEGDDGMNAALVEVDPTQYPLGRPFHRLVAHVFHPYPPELRELQDQVRSGALTVARMGYFHKKLGEHASASARALAREHNIRPDLAALQGPRIQGQRLGSMGDACILAETLGCPVVSDFPSRDIAVGGRGKPLLLLPELWLRGRQEPWISLSLGYSSNMVLWDEKNIHHINLGPAMALLDLGARLWMDRMHDPGGRSADGQVAENLLEAWMLAPSLELPEALSLSESVEKIRNNSENVPWTWIRDLEAIPLKDRLATLSAYVVQTAERAFHSTAINLPLEGIRFWVSGVGSRHRRVWSELINRLPMLPERDSEIPEASRASVGWALLGAASALSIPGNLPEHTGASKRVLLGNWVY